MRRKLSVKLGLLFFVLMLLIELSLFFILYSTISSHRVTEVMDGLLARGAGHRDVLENNYDITTLRHVILMEEEASTDVILTDEEGEIVERSSDENVAFQNKVVERNAPAVEGGDRIVEDDWREGPYVSTVAPIIVDGEHQGDVFMFSPSRDIKTILSHLSDQFLIVMVMIVFMTLILVFALSQIITRPLVKMQKVTEKLSEGKAELELDERHNDELGTLAVSINRLSEDLERLKKERNDFLSSVAHELRTPLTYIKGYADIASRNGTSISDRNHYLSIIKEETVHLTEMVQQLFQLAKLDENTFVIQPSRFSLATLIENAELHIRPYLEEKNATLTIDVPEDLYVVGDEGRMKQVLLNVFHNALTYGGSFPEIHVQAVSLGTQVSIRISDNGEGVPEQALPHLFERLYRVDKARSREQGGSGLGLAIVKEIIEAHGGTVQALNENGLTIKTLLPEGEGDV